MRDDMQLLQIAEQTYLDLEFRQQNGRYQTAVPFVAEGGVVYALVTAEGGRVPWLQPASRVRVVAAAGRAWLDGRARLAWDVERDRALALLRQKYGRARVLVMRLRAWLERRRLAVVAVHM